ncbi:ABC transporter permease [uncultured Alistipes sp.]|jgi:hypothetical protein|uniref:ABC transporter permease n=1 Tax=uncultured Alistipes sp. TaxID=538949 RepID=UPI0025F66502|nr:ABC transporter permease [uncultured Alistipes sp.]
MSQVGIIIGREFNERVRKKSFIITTLLMPVLMIGLMVTPMLIMKYSRGDEKHIAVIDQSGLIAPRLQSSQEMSFEITDLPTEEARKQLTDKFGVLYIGADVMTNPNNVKLYVNSSSSLLIENAITGQIEDIIEAEKLKGYNIENLNQILKEVKTKVGMQTFRNDESQEEESHAKSSVVATGAGFVLGMLLYMILLIYGSMVMQSVIEEKNSRVLEVMVSSVRPFDLMLGKILGIATVAVVQLLIWGVLIFGIGALLMPQLVPADVMASAQAIQQGMPDAGMADMNPEMLHTIAAMSDFGYIIQIFVYLLLFVLGGYLLYSAMFAAVGSAVDSIQDAQQLQTPITIPIILAFVVMMTVMNDPNTQLAFWFSMIPFTSPVVMMARIPYGIPVWEIVLSLVILYASFMAMVWAAAKIYRVGIFMYGKKPTLKELYKWMKYKY